MALISLTTRHISIYIVFLTLTTCCLGGSKKASQQITRQPRMKDKSRKRGMRHMGPVSFAPCIRTPIDLPTEDTPHVQMPHNDARSLWERLLEETAQDIIDTVEQHRSSEYFMARITACRLFYELYERHRILEAHRDEHREVPPAPETPGDLHAQLCNLDHRYQTSNIDHSMQLLIGRERETRNVRVMLTISHDPA